MKYIFIFFSLFSVVYAGTIDPKVPDNEYIEYGKKYKCVLPIVGVISDKLNSSFKASCVVISESYILTAAHIVEDSITQHVIFENKAYPCKVVAIHAQYKSDKIGYHDIAIAKLQRPIKLDFYPELYSKSDEKGKVCGIAGYGFGGTFDTGADLKKFDNKRRAGSNIIDDTEKTVLTFSVNKPLHTSLEFLITPGDSGGGLFIDQKLAGINSYVYTTDNKADSNRNDIGCATRISMYVEWIEKTKLFIESTE